MTTEQPQPGTPDETQAPTPGTTEQPTPGTTETTTTPDETSTEQPTPPVGNPDAEQ